MAESTTVYPPCSTYFLNQPIEPFLDVGNFFALGVNSVFQLLLLSIITSTP